MSCIKTEVRSVSREQLFEANIPERFWTLDIEQYAGTPSALNKLRRYTKNLTAMYRDGVGLIFRGEPDSFKTFLACYVLMYALTQGHSVMYYSMPELVDKILSNEVKATEFKNPAFMVVDNLNAESNNFWGTALSRVLTYRKDAGKPTLLCTRLEDRALTATYGDDNLKLIQALCEPVMTHFDDGERQRRKIKRASLLVEEV